MSDNEVQKLSEKLMEMMRDANETTDSAETARIPPVLSFETISFLEHQNKQIKESLLKSEEIAKLKKELKLQYKVDQENKALIESMGNELREKSREIYRLRCEIDETIENLKRIRSPSPIRSDPDYITLS